MKERLKLHIHRALEICYREGSLDSGTFPEFTLEVPAHPEHGDFATNLAMVLARAEKKAPRKIAEALIAALGESDGLWREVSIAGPGFINFFLTNRCWYGVLDEVVRSGESYGRSKNGAGVKVQVEFVSANPTGPLHIGHGRGAATGDAVAALLEAAGYEVQREYYVNDAGNQVAMLGRSIWVRCRELQGETLPFPEDGYKGDYVRDIARSLLAEGQAELAGLDEAQAIALCSDYGVRKMTEWIDGDLREFGVHFDNWYSERTLYQRDLVTKELGKLRERDLTFEQDGALWLRTTDFGDDKDRVLLRSGGEPTYFASDVAYHIEKFERGFDKVIDVWGADHHGYVPRMKAMLAGLGHQPDDLEVLMIQMVNLLRDGQPVTMGKRSGEFVTLREVIDEVGRDACRFFFLTRRSDSQLDFDLALAKKQSNENPVFYVQYAHARVCSINRNAADQGVQAPAMGEVDFDRLVLEEELALAKLLARYPEVVEGAARVLEPHRITFYLQELAAQFHSYYNRQRVLSDDLETSRARLYLVNSIRIVLKNALLLLGVSAPEQM
ncbi:arginine--tRNA ligase [Desulfuromonas versatilis]|uniref:Arginine--tRNA ligase n=1 Tax=Desulfuromonas versatilis TaxID=2802975 RepID=A0ABN6DWD6_9BACT|nr:arginine--tRNA ligase [Desulfuromonas versatilis]BCR04087.1 arginine--tRNA ligase [Desulfuromonas versatilis]